MSSSTNPPPRKMVVTILCVAFVVNIAAMGAILAFSRGTAPASLPPPPPGPLPLLFAGEAIVLLVASIGWLAAKVRPYSDAYGAPDPAALPPVLTLQTNVVVALAMAEAAAIGAAVRLYITHEPLTVFAAYGAAAAAIMLAYILPTALRCLSCYDAEKH